MPLKLSLVVIAQDEAEDLPRLLESAKDAAFERIVVDGGSKDATVQLARAAGARVVERPFTDFASQKQFALEQAQGDWVLSLDADERLSPELAAEISALLAGPAPAFDAYYLPFENEFLGRTLRHCGLQGDAKLRLFKRSAGRFVGGELHEGVLVEGPKGRLKGFVRHRPYRDLSEYLRKMDLYTTLAARKKQAKGARARPWDILVIPAIFWKRFLFQLGFLDGYAGLVWCALGAFQAWLKRVKLAELSA